MIIGVERLLLSRNPKNYLNTPTCKYAGFQSLVERLSGFFIRDI
jgi:hypothetical protein